MTKLVTTNIDQFTIFFDVVYDVASDLIELQFTDEKMSCYLLNRPRTSFYSIEYGREFFDEYDVGEKSSHTVGMDDMFKVIKLCNKTDKLTLYLDDIYLKAIIESKNGNKRIIEFVMPSDYIDSPNMPQLEPVCTVEVSTDEIKQSLKDIKLVGNDKFQIVADKGHIKYMCDTVDSSDYSNVNYVNEIEANTDIDDTIISRYPMDAIDKLVKFEKISKTVELNLGNEYPLLYHVDDDLMGVHVTVLIAPFVQED